MRFVASGDRSVIAEAGGGRWLYLVHTAEDDNAASLVLAARSRTGIV
jgi:hypothetical protein